MIHPRAVNRRWKSKRGFTLVELLVSISIIAILASMVLFAMAGAQESAREDRTRAQIARIDSLLREHWDSYASRRIDVRVRNVSLDPETQTPKGGRGSEISQAFALVGNLNSQQQYRYAATVARVDGIRELMRMELPERKVDLMTAPIVLRREPYLWRAYRRKAHRMLARRQGRDVNSVSMAELFSGWTTQYQGSECLYLILSQINDDDTNALEFFAEDEIADIDGDGMLEIHDSWGNPIEFLRWAPGFVTSGGAIQNREIPDAFDPSGVYANDGTFALYPLVFSAGPDKLYEINVLPLMHFNKIMPPNNPYFGVPPGYDQGTVPAGAWVDTNKNGQDDSRDNLHNHLLVAGA